MKTVAYLNVDPTPVAGWIVVWGFIVALLGVSWLISRWMP